MKTIITTGYIYPSANPGVVEAALPSLTYLALFSYGINENGGLLRFNGQNEDAASDADSQDLSVIYTELAAQYGVGTLLVLSALSETGAFNTERASLLFRNEAMQDQLIQEILTEITSKSMSGIDFDFEFILPADRDYYTAFVSKATQILNEQGYIVTAALAPKTSADQQGVLYQGHDYYGIGQAANYVLIMTYEWGYTFGPPMAVAPLNQVRRVIEYALSEIPADKILMGIPNYGYDWPLPFIQGETRARSLGNLEALQIAENIGSEILYDELSQSPYFEYIDRNGIAHIVWFENEASIRAKLNLINEYDLAGAGFWNIMRVFPEGFRVLNEMFEIQKV